MRRLVAVLLLCLLLPGAAAAEVFIIGGEAELPEGWKEKELLRLVVIDVERSDAMLLQCGGESMMIDGGVPAHYRRVLATLEENGVTTLKYMYNTHSDGDHSGGLRPVINDGRFKVELLCAPSKKNHDNEYHKKLVTTADRHGIPYHQLVNGDVLTLGDATITVIHCAENWGINNRSAVCQVKFGESRLLLLADVGNQVLRYFLENYDNDLFPCDIMKANHHGINGIIKEFLEVADPELLFITNTSRREHNEALDAMDPLFAGDGTLYMETDGTDWYVWQDPNWID